MIAIHFLGAVLNIKWEVVIKNDQEQHYFRKLNHFISAKKYFYFSSEGSQKIVHGNLYN